MYGSGLPSQSRPHRVSYDLLGCDLIWEGVTFQECGRFTGCLSGQTGDRQEAAAVGFGKVSISLGEFGTDGERGSVELVGEQAEAAIEAGSELADFVGEVEGFLIDEQVLE
jgi:hypothetical protein